jgi:hypothetical protein
MRVAQYYTLLSGCNSETPLGYYIKIRSETSPKELKKLTQSERKIRNDWTQFRASKTGNPKLAGASTDFSTLFGQLRQFTPSKIKRYSLDKQ